MKKRALTLTELLVVIAVILLLAGVTFPLTQAVRNSSLLSVELHQFRQLAVAHGIYLAESDDATPGSTIPLVSSKLAPVELVVSPFDPLDDGFGNVHRAGHNEPKTQYKDSYLTLATVVGRSFFPQFEDSSAGGWLVSFRDHLLKYKQDVVLRPVSYSRLTFDGGLVKRTVPVRFNHEGAPSTPLDRCFSDDHILPDLQW